MDSHSRRTLLIASLLSCLALTGCKNILKALDHGPGYLPGGPLKIAYRIKDQRPDGGASHCFDIQNPTRRAIKNITIGTGFTGIAWRSGENISGSRTSGQMNYWQPSYTPNSSPSRQQIVIKRISGDRAKDASREPHLGEVCYEASAWVMKNSGDFSRLRHSVEFD